MKALHPSDPLTEVRGIPDKSAVPSVFMNYQSTFSVVAPGSDVWEFKADILPHPISFMCLQKRDTAITWAPTEYLNTQLDGATHSLKYMNFLTQAQRWRLAYMSVTVYQDAPALSDQGTIVADQSVVAPIAAHWSSFNGTGATEARARTVMYRTEDFADFDRSQSMPNAYFSRSKEGCYMPLKLTRTCQNWRSQENSVLHASNAGYEAASGRLLLAVGPYSGYPPFTTLGNAWSDSLAPDASGQATSDFCNDVWGHISAKNLSPTTSFTFFFRCGYEIQVQPGTPMTPHQKLSPPYDKLALETYFAIAREMKDAYPADHNDLGKIWDAISSIAKTVSPFLGMIPGIGAPLSLAVTGGANLGDGIKAAMSRVIKGTAEAGSRGSLASAADTALTKAVVNAASTHAQPQPKRQQRRRNKAKSQGDTKASKIVSAIRQLAITRK